MEEKFRRQHTRTLGQTPRKHLESISEVIKCRRKNLWDVYEGKSLRFHPSLSWTKSKENLCLTVDTSWKHLHADSLNNLLPCFWKIIRLGGEVQEGGDWGLVERENNLCLVWQIAHFIIIWSYIKLDLMLWVALKKLWSTAMRWWANGSMLLT